MTATNAKSTSISTLRADLAAEDLTKATKIFTDAKKKGTKEKISATALEKAIKVAKTKLAEVQRSVNGLDCPKDKKWATVSAYDAFAAEIQKAEKYFNKPEEYTYEGVAKYAGDLTQATTDFATQDGKKPDKQPLETKISEAKALVSSTSPSSDGSTIEAGQYWAPQDEIQKLISAFENAETVVKNSQADDEAVNNETEKLKTAITTFENVRTKKQ